ncbi:uncharacterized protein BO66DRAFT_125362 [Aspergillus aculeatinus CBS 121060]|uniref:Uncharacterized protein n=1 Tax=Aspergillus aculeatinus CBS 121060 TaxID=1448322 RepID=A0ACD1H5B9_9EURO|nr:hypothetical protein BO66DRAFT_125362 [Aspergillus aculeatinus CBS 121060]RAH68698.1 hypothetical protein BO66DRAFT_125362 [Aspergillus aculeatinus CBS 121060]
MSTSEICPLDACLITRLGGPKQQLGGPFHQQQQHHHHHPHPHQRRKPDAHQLLSPHNCFSCSPIPKGNKPLCY